MRIEKYPIIFKLMSVLAIAFGALTIRSGAMVLFTTGVEHQAAGHYVPFVLWFNFTAGFVYLVAGLGLWAQQRWAGWLALLIALSTLAVFAAFGLHIMGGGAYEARTVGAMTLRSVLWMALSAGVFWIARKEKAGE
jgi:hypothetical protein